MVCPACGENGAVDIGKLHHVEGGVLVLEDPGHIYACLNCGLYFRRPYPDAAALSSAYEDMVSDSWAYHERKDYHLARQALSKFCPKGNILDVGCFRGDFLDSLPAVYNRHGIEISPEARNAAEQRGVKIIAEMIESMGDPHCEFDAITMMDVIEHIPSPYAALEKLASAAKPGAIIIASTGDTDALPWKVMRLDYWYYFPEHVSFFNRKWFEWSARQLNLEILSIQRFSHFEASWFVRMRQLAEAIVYACVHPDAAQTPFNWILRSIYPFSRVAGWEKPPKSTAWRDHVLVVFRKRGSSGARR